MAEGRSPVNALKRRDGEAFAGWRSATYPAPRHRRNHLNADDLRQASVVHAGLLLQAANSDAALPRAPVPTQPRPTDPFEYPEDSASDKFGGRVSEGEPGGAVHDRHAQHLAEDEQPAAPDPDGVYAPVRCSIVDNACHDDGVGTNVE